MTWHLLMGSFVLKRLGSFVLHCLHEEDCIHLSCFVSLLLGDLSFIGGTVPSNRERDWRVKSTLNVSFKFKEKFGGILLGLW